MHSTWIMKAMGNVTFWLRQKGCVVAYFRVAS